MTEEVACGGLEEELMVVDDVGVAVMNFRRGRSDLFIRSGGQSVHTTTLHVLCILTSCSPIFRFTKNTASVDHRHKLVHRSYHPVVVQCSSQV